MFEGVLGKLHFSSRNNQISIKAITFLKCVLHSISEGLKIRNLIKNSILTRIATLILTLHFIVIMFFLYSIGIVNGVV